MLLSSWLQLEMGQELQAILACSRGQRGQGVGHRQAATCTGSSGRTPRALTPLTLASQGAEDTRQGWGSLALCSQGLRARASLSAGPRFPRLEGEGLGLSRQHQGTLRAAARTSHWSKAKKTPPQTPGPSREAPPGVGRGKLAAGQDDGQGQPSGGQTGGGLLEAQGGWAHLRPHSTAPRAPVGADR